MQLCHFIDAVKCDSKDASVLTLWNLTCTYIHFLFYFFPDTFQCWGRHRIQWRKLFFFLSSNSSQLHYCELSTTKHDHEILLCLTKHLTFPCRVKLLGRKKIKTKTRLFASFYHFTEVIGIASLDCFYTLLHTPQIAVHLNPPTKSRKHNK